MVVYSSVILRRVSDEWLFGSSGVMTLVSPCTILIITQNGKHKRVSLKHVSLSVSREFAAVNNL